MTPAMRTPRTLGELLRWAAAAYRAEQPELQHSVSLTDDGGAPAMEPAAKRYLGLSGPSCKARESDDRATRRIHADCTEGCHVEPDNYRRAAYAITDGHYRTPLHRAIEEIADPTRRLFAKWLIANALRPSDIARTFEIPDWCAGDVIYRTLDMVRQRYREQPPAPERGWISGRSDSQRAAESEAA